MVRFALAVIFLTIFTIFAMTFIEVEAEVSANQRWETSYTRRMEYKTKQVEARNRCLEQTDALKAQAIEIDLQEAEENGHKAVYFYAQGKEAWGDMYAQFAEMDQSMVRMHMAFLLPFHCK